MDDDEEASPVEARPAPARGRRVNEARRREIVDKAAVLFLRDGYEAVSIDDIVAEIGGSKATLYTWFGGKAGLFETVIKEYCETTSRGLEVEFSGEGPIERQLVGVGVAFITLILSERSLELVRLTVSIGKRFPSVGQTFFESGPRRAYGIVAEWMRRQQAAGRLAAGDAERMATLFLDMLVGRLQLAHLLSVAEPSRPQEIEATARAAARLFLDGARPPPSEPLAEPR